MSDKEDIFSTPESEARLDLIKHLIENSELVPLVRGVPGIGKTLLASRLQAGAPDNWVVCLFEADSMMQPERLLAHVARCNGLPDAKEDNIRRLVERFELFRKRGTIPVLLIDEAQKLPPTSLITLLRLFERQVGGGPLLSLVLFADEQIDMLLSTPQLQIMSPQSIQVIDLPPLSREEADNYMRYLLRQEGLERSLELESGRMDRIYRDSNGAPGPLGSAILKEVGEMDGAPAGGGLKISKPLLWAGLPLGVLILLLLVFQGPINQIFSPEPETLEEPVIAQLPPPEMAVPSMAEEGQTQSPPIVLPSPGPAGPTPTSERGISTAPGPDLTEGQGVVEPPVALAEPTTDLAPDSEPAAVPEDPESAPVQPEPVTEQQASKAEEAEMPETLSSAPTAGTDSAALPPPSEIVSMPEQGEPAEQGGSPQKMPETEEVAAPEAAAVAGPPSDAPEKPAESHGMLRTDDWLSSQPKGSYTLQLLAVGSLQSIQSTVQKYGLLEQAFSVRKERQGRPWYPLLWGVYPDRETALAATRRLPPELQKSGAWARPVDSLLP